jgi:UDP-3-O-[3-hydroxymyristoyl] glucosamine N-acyltransferase
LPTSLAEIGARLGAELIGVDAQVSGVASLEDAGPSDVTVCFDRRRAQELKRTKAAGVIIPRRAIALQEVAPCAVLLVDEPRLALARVLEHFHPEPEVEGLVREGARVEPGASVGVRTIVSAGAVIESGAVVGDDCRIGSNAVVASGCTLGNRVILGPGAVIGSCGFGFVPEGDGVRKIPQVGGVVIEDDVEIGANTTVDRATLGATRIGKGTKIDNLVQVGHNVSIGRNVLIAAQVGLSGSVRIEDGAVLGGQVGVADHVVIGAGAQVGAKSGVGTHVPPGARVAGYPAVEVQHWLENAFLWRRVRKLLKRSGGKGSKP